MAVWARASGSPETWSEMEDAARERYWDGMVLACGDQRETGAIYMWGYVAEILLKCACLRVVRTPGNVGVKSALQARGIRHHRLMDLADDLRTVRAAALRPLDSGLERLLRTCVITLTANWDVMLRYRSTHATEAELSEVYAAVEWLMNNYSGLV